MYTRYISSLFFQGGGLSSLEEALSARIIREISWQNRIVPQIFYLFFQDNYNFAYTRYCLFKGIP